MSKEDKKIIKIILICLPFAIAFAAGLAALLMKYDVLSSDLNYSGENSAADAYKALGIMAVFVVVMFAVITLEDAIDNKTGRRVRRSADTSYGYGVTYNDRHTDNDDDTPTEFRRPIGVMPTPWEGKGSFSDYYGHKYTNIGGTIYDDNGNFCPDYMRSYYGIPDDEDSQNDGW